MPRGLLIVFEGIDNSGKTTHARQLALDLANARHLTFSQRNPVAFCFPRRSTEVGKLIDSYLRGDTTLPDQVIHLLMSANRWEMKEEIEWFLSKGSTVILDRYWYSGVAYSCAKGLDPHWCQASDIGLPRPDLVIYLDLPPEVAAGREDYGKEVYENLEYQQKAWDQYQILGAQEDLKNIWKRVDSNLPIEEVKKEIYDAAVACIDSMR